MADNRRLGATAAALVLAPIEACALVAFLVALLAFGAGAGAVVALFGFVFLSALLFALPITLVFGALAHRLFQRLGVVGWRAHVSAGLAAGAASVAIFGFAFEGVYRSLLPVILILSPPIGALTGLFAWMIRRPDWDQTSSAASSRATSA